MATAPPQEVPPRSAYALVDGTHDMIPDVGRFDRLVLTPEPDAAPLAGAAGLALALRARRTRRG